MGWRRRDWNRALVWQKRCSIEEELVVPVCEMDRRRGSVNVAVHRQDIHSHSRVGRCKVMVVRILVRTEVREDWAQEAMGSHHSLIRNPPVLLWYWCGHRC